jgi:hypothetical protein
MHLAAGRCAPALDRIQQVADARDRACPPLGRTLLGPAETWNHLVVLADSKSDGPPAQIEERAPNAPSPHIDCENQNSVVAKFLLRHLIASWYGGEACADVRQECAARSRG